MAPNGHGPSGPSDVHDVHQTQLSQQHNWLDEFGHSEYQSWCSGNPTKHLSFDDWKTSKHVDGLSLYYATLQIFEESGSSSEEAELIEVKPRLGSLRGASTHGTKKKKNMNGTRPSRATESATPSAPVHSEDQNASSKRKRKSRKKYLSEEIVASDDDSELEEVGKPESSAGAEISQIPPAIVSGRHRKSYTRKPRKTPLSEETVSPEDELDDPMTLDEVVTSSIASPLPLRSAPNIVSIAHNSESPKKTLLKLSTKRVPKKKFLSEETVVDDDTENAKTPTSATDLKIISVENENAPIDAYDHDDSGQHATNESASLSLAKGSTTPTRRGLRARRPAQQRPYYHDAQLFDDVGPNAKQTGDENNDIFDAGSRRVSVVSLTKGINNDLEDWHEDNISPVQDDTSPGTLERRPKHFKGKGRAWKKEESDEDEDFTPKKKAAKAAKAKPKSPAVAKKRGRPRKSVLSEDIIRDDSDSDVAVKGEESSGHVSSVSSNLQVDSRRPKPKPKPKPKKSALSEEIVRDDSDSEDETVDDSEPSVATQGSQERAGLPNSNQGIRFQSCVENDVGEKGGGEVVKESPSFQELAEQSEPLFAAAHELETPGEEIRAEKVTLEGEGNLEVEARAEKQSVGGDSLDDRVSWTRLPEVSSVE